MANGKYEQWIEPEGLQLLEKWKREGLSDKQIAEDKIGVSERTLTDWKNRFPSVSSALKKGREVVVGELENALIKSALGFLGNDGKFYPPNITALIFALKNMAPEKWREQQKVELSGNVSNDNPFKNLSTEELIKLAESGEAA